MSDRLQEFGQARAVANVTQQRIFCTTHEDGFSLGKVLAENSGRKIDWQIIDREGKVTYMTDMVADAR